MWNCFNHKSQKDFKTQNLKKSFCSTSYALVLRSFLLSKERLTEFSAWLTQTPFKGNRNQTTFLLFYFFSIQSVNREHCWEKVILLKISFSVNRKVHFKKFFSESYLLIFVNPYMRGQIKIKKGFWNGLR